MTATEEPDDREADPRHHVDGRHQPVRAPVGTAGLVEERERQGERLVGQDVGHRGALGRGQPWTHGASAAL